MQRVLRSTALAAALTLATATAHAGQVRVNASNFAFVPQNVTVNSGDHVVWIWTGGSHSVTSGDADTMTPDGRFATPGFSITTPTSFTWQGDILGSSNYYCNPHTPDMVGIVTVVASGASVSNFHISEVQFNAAGNLDLIEIHNLGVTGNLGKYRIAGTGFTTQAFAATDIIVPADGFVVIHCNTTGTNTSTDQYLPAITDLPAAGSVALYAPNTAFASLALADQMVDFVQWGAPGQANEATAQTAGLWSTGQSLNNVADGHSIEFCGLATEHGALHWGEISAPNFGSNGNCITPTRTTSWGRIKAIYR